jgi:hypothetical protein
MRHQSQEEANKAYAEQLKKDAEEALKEGAHHIDRFQNMAEAAGITLGEKAIQYFQKVGIVAQMSDILTRLNTDLLADKEGLFAVTDLLRHYRRERMAGGNLYGDTYIVLAHPYFRRGFHHASNYAPAFLDCFWALDHITNQTSLALDTDRVRINVDRTEFKEFDYWHGAKFCQAIGEIPDGTVKLRPPLDIPNFYIDFAFANAYALDIKWSTSGSIRNFYAEEIKTEDVTVTSDGLPYFPVRYLHAEFDNGTNHFRHLDGAIHLYTEEEYFRRRDSDLNFNNKNDKHIKTLSKKLFKINGAITVETWRTLISQFLAGNPLIIEYLEGAYPQQVTEIVNAAKQSISR